MAKEAVVPNAEAIEQHIAVLAGILDKYALCSLEYEVDGISIKLGKENARPAARHAIGSVGSAIAPASDIASFAFEKQAEEEAEKPSLPSSASAFSPPTDLSASASVAAKNLVTAPLVGIAYRSKEPGSAAFVNIGDSVEKGTVLCLVEAMKMFNEVKAPVAGVITDIHFDDASLVEYAAPLFTLEPTTFDPVTLEPAIAG